MSQFPQYDLLINLDGEIDEQYFTKLAELEEAFKVALNGKEWWMPEIRAEWSDQMNLSFRIFHCWQE